MTGRVPPGVRLMPGRPGRREAHPPAARMPPANRPLVTTVLVSLGLHALAVTAALLLLRNPGPVVEAAPQKPTEVELVMEERKGDLRPTSVPAPPAAAAIPPAKRSDPAEAKVTPPADHPPTKQAETSAAKLAPPPTERPPTKQGDPAEARGTPPTSHPPVNQPAVAEPKATPPAEHPPDEPTDPSEAKAAAPSIVTPEAAQAELPRPIPTQADAAVLPPAMANPPVPQPKLAAVQPVQPPDSAARQPAQQPTPAAANQPDQTAKPDPAPQSPMQVATRDTSPLSPAPPPAPIISLQGTDSPSNARAFGDRVIPARPDAVFHNRPPVYPDEAAMNGQQGTVVVVIHVSPAGTAAGVELLRSSGYVLLDRAAQEAVMRWRFLPAVKDGQPVASDMTMGFIFDDSGGVHGPD